MKLKTFTLLGALLLCAASAKAEMTKETHTFYIAGPDTLRLDRYTDLAAVSGLEARPLVLFAFGGGFQGGERDNAEYLPFFEFLTSHGIDVVSTDYRTSLSGIGRSDITTPQAFATALVGAVTTAVGDYLRAAAFVGIHAPAWGVDPSKIIACGTSAGAITALQAEYEITRMDPAPPVRFAGVISFAGAICSAGDPRWESTPCPMLLFHGDADSTVPYNEITYQGNGLYGSKVIADGLTRAGVPHIFYTIASKGHEVALSPMKTHTYEILGFIRQYAIGHENAIVDARQTFPGAPTDYRTDFTLDDYIRSNMQ